MHNILLFSVFIAFQIKGLNFWWLKEGGNHVAKIEWYEEHKYHVSCSFWSWGRCTKRKQIYYYRLECENGWTNRYVENECNYAICDGKTNYQGACNIYYYDDYQLIRGNPIAQRSSGGNCVKPNKCNSCNDGFYEDGPYCRICGRIDHCNHRRCKTGADQECHYCEGEVQPNKYYRAYTRDIDGGKTCQKACSWRSDSTRCYPGTCANELANNCICAANFGGTHCEQILDTPAIEMNHAVFYDSQKLFKLENLPNYVQNDKPTNWTNFVGFSQIQTSMTAKYLQPSDKREAQHYVKDFRVGLVLQTITLSFYKDGTFVSSQIKYCSGMNQDQPVDYMVCNSDFTFGIWPNPRHNDHIIFSVAAKNGGYIVVENRETTRNDQYYYQGRTVTREFEFHWDLVNPFHCSVTQGAGCSPFASVGTDITSNPSITLTWGGWVDELAGLDYYEYEIYDLGHDGTALVDGINIAQTTVRKEITDNSAQLTISRRGVYSVHFTAFDKAGNYKTGRTLFLFDDRSVVDVLAHKQTICSTASQETLYKWVVIDTNTVKIIWTDRFINSHHVNNRFLNMVKTFAPSSEVSIYEDLYGDRTNAAIDNIHGIVNFQVSYKVHGPSLKDSRPLTSVSNIHNEYDILILNWADGDRLEAIVRAIDVMGMYKEDTIYVYRDATPAVIENLWLTRGDRINISVHRIEDFTEMTIEWLAYDDHSGLDSVSWKLYDKYSGTVIVHGYEDIAAQGETNTLTECQTKYGSYARGANCYCTNFMGCYHRHFQIKPEIKASGGLILNLDKGVHDYDYHIDITVINKAKLTTLLTKKITIDVSPPHTGVVHDGLVGNPEIDYQQGKVLNAYWDQFFDRESGVFFYQYIVGSSCAGKEDFNLDHSNPKLIETYNTYGSHTVSLEGTYYFTVVAYNRALEPSDTVCSDGVTVDTSKPGVKEVVIKDAHIVGGLITDIARHNYYILASDSTRRQIIHTTPDCVSKATIVTAIDLLPIEKFQNGSFIEVDGRVFCQNSTGAPSTNGIILSKSSLIEMSWEPVDIPAEVYDYEVGFSSTAASPAPDLMSFQSTKQHAHFRVIHGNIPDGTKFYIIIKAISKSNIEGLTTIGPCFIDTTPPDFAGTISISLTGYFLIASWPVGAFSDSEDLFDLAYEFSIGHKELGIDVQGYKPLTAGGSCTLSNPPICVAANIKQLDWYLHGHHTYYINIKVTNTAGLVAKQASSPYIHDVQLPSKGVVLDISTENFQTDIPFKDIEDIDFQTDISSLSARWSGFVHPHLDVTYAISIGRTKGGSDVISPKNIGTNSSHKTTGLSLITFQKYYFTVTAITTSGSTSVSSDGVTIITENAVLPGVKIYDGQPCNMTSIKLDHHEEDNRLYCADDIDVQMSLNSIKAYWTVPDVAKPYTADALIAIEKRSQVGNIWVLFRDFEYFSTVFDVSINDLTLTPGIMYRVVLKLCARTICFDTIKTDGVMVMPDPPVTGGITVDHQNVTQGGGTEKLKVTFDQFYDPDIENETEKYSAVDKYEYAVTDDSVHGKIYMPWTTIKSYSAVRYKISFEVALIGKMDFSRCKRFTVRGYNQAKLYSIVSKEIKNCKAYNPILIKPNIVIDAVGEPDVLDGIGKTVYLAKNDLWRQPDQDYTPYKNIISAVWPKLRHRSYKYAVLNAKSVDVTTYYHQINQLDLSDPCSHPDALKCGSTESEFTNIEFTNGELVHGTRYIVCIHANYKEIPNEQWTDVLPEVNACSDGIIVDLTPPSKGNVWIGNMPTLTHQTINTDIYVNWDDFHDIEEYNNGPHSTGIKEYILGIGTTSGGNDVFPFENVGVVQHKALHGLNLQNGYSYYATLKAVDFANRETVVTSNPVIVDITPPAKSNSPITISNRHITSTTELEACWKNVFADLESGVDFYLWSVGSEPGYNDMMAEIKVVDSECGITNINNPLELLDGHYYYINVRAFNKAGLSSLATSWAFQVDTAPPVSGHVYDGDITMLTSSIKDLDYQTETKLIHAYWEGFHDSHSVIQEYYISIGTCPGCDDILLEQAIGITQEYTLRDIHLGPGIRYYTTITACNTAEFCTSVTSDGVVIDNSPPTAGVVQDGTGLYDKAYQSMRNYVSAKWYGFTDPQSGLEKFVWRVGTSKGGDDIMRATELHITDMAAVSNSSLNLPVNKKIYVTVRAYNNAGLWTESSSNGFIVDNTGPVISFGPDFSVDYGIHGLTQIYRSSTKVEWVVDDPESYIQRQYLSIKSHIGGEFQLSSQKVNGIARSYVFTGLHLHDGVTYYVTLISCNGADICVTSTSQGILVDTTPPSRGMFAINTDHASSPDLSRHSEGWMTWLSNSLNLAWLGFSDVHSGIDHYKIMVGSSYMARDLTKYPDQKYLHTTVNTDHGDEGKVQLFTIQTLNLLNAPTVYVTVWAVNGAGLLSRMIHSAFRRLPGALDLIRRCDAVSCEGHCVCAPQDQKCPLSANLPSCNDVSAVNPNSLLLVIDTNGYVNTDLDLTSSDNILRGQWIISQSQGLLPQWYEWSVGYSGFSSPNGIYNIVHDKVWQDRGQLMEAVFTMSSGKSLEEDSSYSFYIKAWYKTDTYAIFMSDGIKATYQTPAVSSVGGKALSERTLGKKVKDEDYFVIGRPIEVIWNGTFLQANSTIKKYKLYLSTYPGGRDIWTGQEDIPGSAVGYNMTRSNLAAGVKYYTNIVAYTYAGIHVTVTSDGFIVDHVKPTSGVIFDGTGRIDLEYQNSSIIVGSYWHGFTDNESGIRSYKWCVGTTIDKTECGVMDWVDVGLQVSASRKLSTEISLGIKIYNKVYALDNVGFASDIAVSDGDVIDRTPPVSVRFIHADENIAQNPSFENTNGTALLWEVINSTDICTIGNDHRPMFWQPISSACFAVVTSLLNLAKDGRSFMFVRGGVEQKIENIRTGKVYKISFFSCHLPMWNSVAANKEGFVQLGNSKKIFLIYTKAYRRDGHGDETRKQISWHKHTFYFKASNDRLNLIIGSVDVKTGLFIDDLSVQEVTFLSDNLAGHISGHIVYLHEWGSIHGSWNFIDAESPVVDYTWGIGYAEGGTQIQPFISEGLMNFGYNSNVTLIHNSFIYVTVVATNTAGLKGVAYSDPILVDLTPPDIKFVYDGRGVDEDSWIYNEVVANWEVEDPESGIKACKWAIGYHKETTELLTFTEVTGTTAFLEFDYSVLEGHTIYTTVSCESNAGLISVKSSDGVKISERPPSADSAVISLVPAVVTEYNPYSMFQGATDNVRLKWSGFTDNIGIDSYMVTFANSRFDQVFFPTEQDNMFAYYTKASLASDSTYKMSVQAVNKVFLKSSPVNKNLTVYLGLPQRDGSKQLLIYWAKNKFTASWDKIFTSKHHLFYEVSAGTSEAGVNILQWQYTNQTSVTFGMPASVEASSGLKVYVTIGAVSVGGFYDFVKGETIIP